MTSPAIPRPEENFADDLRRRLEGFYRLLNAAHALAVEIDLQRILKIIVDDACRALDCDRASLYQFDAKRNELVTTVVTELEIAEIRKSVDTGISGWVARERHVANIPDAALDNRWDSTIDRATGYHTQNILAAPLISTQDNTLLGVLMALNKHHGVFDRSDELLIEAFGQHAAAALDRTRLVAKVQEREQTEASLNVAREVQRRFMPQKMPQVPGYEFATWWYPHEAVGGDYCDLLRSQDGRTVLCVADVSGHGLGPSLLMASVRAALRTLLLAQHSPAELLNLLGQALADDLDDSFITLILVMLDPCSHRIEFANAGHGPAMHFVAGANSAAGHFLPLGATGMPLGVVPGTQYPAGPSVALAPGDMLLLCTDGIIEAMDDSGQQFGQHRLEQIVQARARGPLSELVEAIGSQVSAHYAGSSPPDDLTILVARRNVGD